MQPTRRKRCRATPQDRITSYNVCYTKLLRELQGIKKGVLEVADAIVVNKADGDNVNRAKLAKKQYETALHLVTPSSPNWMPPVMTCSALEHRGLEEVWETILKHKDIMTNSGELDKKRRDQAMSWMWFLVNEGP